MTHTRRRWLLPAVLAAGAIGLLCWGAWVYGYHPRWFAHSPAWLRDIMQTDQDWTPLAVPQLAHGQWSWTPSVQGPVEVRLHVQDKAQNQAEGSVTVRPGEFHPAAGAPAPEAPRGNIIYVKSRTFQLSYSIEDEGPSGVKNVEVWWTKDTRLWQLYAADARRRVAAEGAGADARPVGVVQAAAVDAGGVGGEGAAADGRHAARLDVEPAAVGVGGVAREGARRHAGRAGGVQAAAVAGR